MTLYEEVRAALRESAFRPKKSLGQNFLIHERVIDAILRLLDLAADDEVVEIGPGLGFLTRHLLEHAAKVWAVEVDPVLVERLRGSELAGDPKLGLVHGDILEIALPQLASRNKMKLAGNLPYSISTPVLFRIFEWREHFSTLVLMLQKEVADRMMSGPGTKDYGSLSVWCQVHGRITEKVSVSPEAFFPRPKVRSTILKFELYDQPLVKAEESPALRALVRAAFNQRRKTLSNALSAWLKGGKDEIERLLQSADVDPQRRGETLRIEEFIKLARAARGESSLTTGN
ncbi:MAG TPA: 16S rRNA (adenine(1518)-N(6)/adenine(1519)-N(6))-dimethyltransferase RsmA [Candidatus Binatia bacterium]|nr:16S rRNA (adenine(1518)-N(6)/adenine(1519)-N(6))-dimethyltransferase RsmA [Candidatus Binatia bacterium]